MNDANKKARILAWEAYAYRACDLCVYGYDDLDHANETRQRRCINQQVRGDATGSVPVSIARAKADATIYPNAQEMPTRGSAGYGACGPDAKFLDFPGLNAPVRG